MTQLLPDIFAIEVPEDAKDFVIDMGYLIFKVMDMDPKKWVTDKQIEQDVRRFLRTGKSRFDDLKEESMWQTSGVPISPGSYEILFTTKDCSEEQQANLVEKDGDGYKDYESSPTQAIPYSFAPYSFRSLLRSHNLTGKNYLLIKKQP